jgi:hypothetical protein
MRSSAKTRVSLAALALLLTAALVACGNADKGRSEKSVAGLIEAAHEQVGSHKYVTVKGKEVDKEKPSFELELRFADDTVSGTVVSEGNPLHVLRVNGKSYSRSSGTSGGRWVLAETSDPTFRAISTFVSKDRFFQSVLDPALTLMKGKEKTINGVECVSLHNAQGVLYLDKSDGKPIQQYSNLGLRLNFTYDKLAAATAPAPDDVADVSNEAQ